MANQGKHKKSPLMDWVEGEDSAVPTKSRGAHVVDAYIKKAKVTVRKFGRPAAEASAPAKPEAALMRQPALPLKVEGKPSQTACWEHQKRLERLTPLRAPYQYKGH